MKYYSELTKIEDSIYEIEKIRACLNILCETETMSSGGYVQFTENFKTFIYDLESRMAQNTDNLKDQFNNLWDTIRNDSWKYNDEEISSDRWNHIVNDLAKWNTSENIENNIIKASE